MQAIGSGIMNIKIGNLTITSFCSDNIEHIRFRKDLKHDYPIYEFVSTNIESDLQEVHSDNIELERSYIIQANNDLVGYICIKEISEEEGIVELRYAVHPEFRRLGYLGYHDKNRKGYGQQILEECSNYLFTLDNINSVELHIRKDNQASIGCAEKAKYKCLGENNEEYFYIYRTYKRNEENEN